MTTTLIYHITDLDNLPAIVASGLVCKSGCDQNGANSVNIAHAHIQDRRASTVIPAGPGGYLHDYVPFYFCPRSPMLFAIHKGMVEGYGGDQSRVLHLVTSVNRVHHHSLAYVFTDGHAAMCYTSFFETYADLQKLDWKVIGDNYWGNTADDPDRKRRKQAEFLVHGHVPWDLIDAIGVMNRSMASAVQRILQDAAHRPVVKVERKWYY